MCAASVLSAQNKKSLKDINKELKQTKSTATAMALINQIAETTPQTEEDVVILGQLMDKYPTQGQKALTGIKNPKLAKAVMKECDRQVAKFKADKDKNWKTLPENQRREKFNALLNTHAMIATLGTLKNKEAIPFLKQYITPEYDGVLSYEASKAIGRIAPDDPAVFKELWDKQGVKGISYNAYGKSVLKEVAQKMQDPNVPEAEKDRIRSKAKISLLSGKNPEEKRLIKDILLNHPNRWLREDAGVAMLHALKNRKDPEDVDFVLKWTSDPKNSSSGWAMYYMRDNFDAKFTPILLRYLKESEFGSTRSDAAQALAINQVKESLPYLKECVVKDKDSDARGACRTAYYKIAGKFPTEFNVEDVDNFYKSSAHPVVIEYYSNKKPDDPERKRYEELKKAMDEFKSRRK